MQDQLHFARWWKHHYKVSYFHILTSTEKKRAAKLGPCLTENKRTPIGLRDTAKGHKESSGTRGQGHDLHVRGQGHDPFGKDAGHDRIFEDTKRTSAGKKGHKKDTGHDPSRNERV